MRGVSCNRRVPQLSSSIGQFYIGSLNKTIDYHNIEPLLTFHYGKTYSNNVCLVSTDSIVALG